MNKRTGFVAGAALLAAGIGIPGFAGAAADEARPSYHSTERIERAASAGVPDFGIGRVEASALGMDATGGTVSNARGTSGAARYGLDTVEASNVGIDPHAGVEVSSVLSYGLKNVEVNALGVDPYGGFVETWPSIWDVDRTPNRATLALTGARHAGLPDFGIDRPEVSAFEADPNASTHATGKSTPIPQGEITDPYAMGLDPFGGAVETWDGAGTDGAVEVADPYAMGLDPWGGVTEQA